MIVTGVAAVLDQPMLSRPVTFTRPRPFLTAEGAPVIHDGKQVGDVLRAWVDGNLVRWEGRIEQPPALLDGEQPFAVPPYEPTVGDLISAGSLVGLTDLVQGRMETRAGVTVLSGWAVSAISLVAVTARPWEDLCLTIRDTGMA